MSDNDNSVNMENDKSRYHHGDLRAALIAEGLRHLASGNAETLSLRAIARDVGVSPTAVYRHFPDKQALLSALAMEGGAQLACLQKQAQDAAGGGRAGFDATGRAYVRFALQNPALFRLITAQTRNVSPTDVDRDRTGLDLLRRNIAALAAPGASKQDQHIGLVRSWATVHGLAMLMLDGQIPTDESLIDLVVDTSAFWFGA